MPEALPARSEASLAGIRIGEETMDYWNHNVHYQSLILAVVPPGCGSALDVGCGDGLLACRLAAHCRDVTGVDRDRRMIQLARQRGQNLHNVAFIDAEFPAFPFDDESFDFIVSDTAIHHMNFEAALMAMRRLLRPRGQLAIVGLARSAKPADWMYDVAGIPANVAYGLVHGALRAAHREAPGPGQPIKAPTMTWDEVRVAALRLLPGAQYRRHLLFRYSLLWRKPSRPAPPLPVPVQVPRRDHRGRYTQVALACRLKRGPELRKRGFWSRKCSQKNLTMPSA